MRVRFRLLASVPKVEHQTPGMDDMRARRSAVLLLDVAVGKTPGERAGSLVRVGSENGHLVRRTQAVRREGVVHGGSEVHLRKRAARFLGTALSDSHRRRQQYWRGPLFPDVTAPIQTASVIATRQARVVAQRWHELGLPRSARETRAWCLLAELEEALVAIVAGFDVHRAQITFDALDERTGEVSRGCLAATPEAVRGWVSAFAGQRVDVAVEACTGWLFVCEALQEAGAVPHLAEAGEASALRGKKRRAKTDREDARWLRTLLCEGRLPEAWIPPAHVREWRSRTRLRKTLVVERTTWLQRIQATLFHHGIAGAPDKLLSVDGRRLLAALELPNAALERIEVSLQMIEAIDGRLAPLEQALRQLARRQPAVVR